MRTSLKSLSVFLLPWKIPRLLFGIFVVLAVEEDRGKNIFAIISKTVPKRHVRIVVVFRRKIFSKSAKTRFYFCFNKWTKYFWRNFRSRLDFTPLKFRISESTWYRANMVDRNDLVVFYVEHEYGGTWQIMKYAVNQKKKIINLVVK